MTVAELIEKLEYMDPDAEVRIAAQPTWPLEYDIISVSSEVMVNSKQDLVVYLEEGRQLGYLPSEAEDELGW